MSIKAANEALFPAAISFGATLNGMPINFSNGGHMRAKFTPGPWIHDGDEVHGADGSMIASNISSGKGFDVKMANARLMASAPQLLESLEMISGMLKSGELVRDTHRDGRANFSEVMMSYVSTLNKIMAAIYAAKGEP